MSDPAEIAADAILGEATYVSHGLPRKSASLPQEYAVLNRERIVSVIRAAYAMKWTADTPTEPGWYWLRLRDAVDIVDVEQTDEGLCILWDAAPRDRVADMRGAFWSGPLQPPGVPE